jgi:hypothetical protein
MASVTCNQQWETTRSGEDVGRETYLELEVLNELLVDADRQLALVAERLQAHHAVLVHLQRVVLELEHQ